MPEAFLFLLAAGVMLAGAVSDPKQVTLRWLRLGGIIALSMSALAFFFWMRREASGEIPASYYRVQSGMVGALVGAILGQLAFVQVAWRGVQRGFAWGAFTVGVLLGSHVLHEMMVLRGTAVNYPPKVLSMMLQTWSCAGVAAMCGGVLMEMLLGHAYLTASQMTMRPFARLNRVMAGVLVLRALVAVGGVIALQMWRPMAGLWSVQGFVIGTRWFVGLMVVGVFVYMAHDCIKRRATQSATGILYVAGVLVFIGEMMALYLVRETGLPF
jgi:hypothetical protein